MSGLFAAVGGTLENGMSTYVTSVSSALSSALVAVLDGRGDRLNAPASVKLVGAETDRQESGHRRLR